MTKKELLLDEDKNIIGHKIDVRVKKLKSGSYDPSKVFTVNFYNHGGFNIIDEYAQIFCEKGIVEVGGAGWITLLMSSGEEKKVQGIDNFAKYLKENPIEFEFLKDQLV